MRKFTAAGFIAGLALFGAVKIGSAFMEGMDLLFFLSLFVMFFGRMRHATLMAKVGPRVTPAMKRDYANPIKIALQVFLILAISLVIGYAAGWLLGTILR